MRCAKCTVEPVFGLIKHVMKFLQFLLRGIASARGEWSLVCLGVEPEANERPLRVKCGTFHLSKPG